MPEYVVRRTALALNERNKSLRGSAVLVLGGAYKPNIDDTRESPGIEIIERLSRLGAKVAYNDPHVPRTNKMGRHISAFLASRSVSKPCRDTIASSLSRTTTPIIGR
jgi:UDP-N-acetyl-D-glucosamine dehydrogenase